ncbi:MAG TPA: sigma-70 family RNA polymerase sigma factor [Myxococcota bacterium]|nr:sigma-70 family RNA polymerase sigma factor [Myxococcota bacterium]
MPLSGSNHDSSALYQRFGPMILRRVRDFYGQEESEEVLGELFVRVFDKPQAFRGESSLGTWIYGATTRYCLHRRREDDPDDQPLYSPSAILRAEEPDQQRQSLLLEKYWRNLDEDLVLIGIYYYLDGMGHPEIAELVGSPRRTIGARILELDAQLRVP